MVLVRRSVLQVAAQHALSESPREACGVLLGVVERGGAGEPSFDPAAVEPWGWTAEVVEARPARNVAVGSLDRYELHPLDFLDADEQARRVGLEVVGFYHSHPSGEAVPSETDRLWAWDGHLYLIAGLRGAGGPPGERGEVPEPHPLPAAPEWRLWWAEAAPSGTRLQEVRWVEKGR